MSQIITQPPPTNQSPATALTTALHLAEMNPEQLASASKSLLAAEERYDRMSGICATLNGLVLLEARRKIAHGNFTQWVKDVTGKSDRDARYRMRIAEQFIESLSKRKTEACFRFETATQLLLEDFAAMLGAEAASPMDESNPVFAAVASYVDGRSYRALADSLPAKLRGGARTPGTANSHHSEPEEDPVKLLADICRNAGKHLACVHKQRAYIALIEAELDGLRNHCEAVADAVKNWQKLTKGQREEQLGGLLAK